MRRILAIVLSILIGVQGIVMISGNMEVQAEEAANSEESEEQQGETEEQTEESAQTEDQTQEAEEAVQTEDQTEQAGEGSGIEVSAPSAILMEASTGKIIYEKDADTRRPPASVTKIMTLLLIFDALADNRIALEDEVQTSEYAASMGGSQVFLEPGETQTVDTMIKCIAVASANDACASLKNSRQYDHAFTPYEGVISQTTAEPVSLYDAAVQAQKELKMDLSVLVKMEKLLFLSREQWDKVMERVEKLKDFT